MLIGNIKTSDGWKNKKIKCHENKYNCRKISFQELYNNTDKYIGRTIQFIIRYHKCSPTKEINPILWHCKLGGIHNPYDNVFRPFYRVDKSRGLNKSGVGLGLSVAQDIAKDTRLLCFDEMFVEDVADAMLLGRLFTALFDAGVYIVMTSNIKPDDLYKNGLQRDRFVPFIELLKEKTEVVAFDGDKDYRSENIRDYHRFLYPDDDNARTQMQNVFETPPGSSSLS